MKKYKIMLLLLIGIALFLMSCSSDSRTAAPKAVEKYLQALVEEDANRLSMLVCKDFEQQARLELDSFIGVKASLKNMKCDQSGTDGDVALVTCSGSIVATYNNEQQELPLTGRTYRVIMEGGDWLVCGYQ